jgi:hypothetical protein
MKYEHCRAWNMKRNLENVKNEKCTLCDLEIAKNTEKRGK